MYCKLKPLAFVPTALLTVVFTTQGFQLGPQESRPVPQPLPQTLPQQPPHRLPLLRQDVRVYSSLPDRGCHLIHELQPERRAWLQVLKGRIRLDSMMLVAGDGVAFQDERSVSITALEPSEVLLFDLA